MVPQETEVCDLTFGVLLSEEQKEHVALERPKILSRTRYQPLVIHN